MKKNIVFALMFLSISINAQKLTKKDHPVYFSLEAKGGITTALLTNNNVADDEYINYFNPMVSPSFGIGFGTHFTKDITLQIEKNWTEFKQKYIYLNNIPEKIYKFKTGDIGFFVRGTGENGGFVGIGFKMAKLAKVSVNDSIVQGDYFAESMNFLHFELGGPVWQNNMFDITINFRVGYCITDISKAENYTPGAYLPYPEDSYTGTYPLTVQFFTGFNWNIGYFATSQCKHKGFLFFKN